MPFDPSIGHPCIYCGTMSGHYTAYVCESQRKTMLCFPLSAEDKTWSDMAFLQSMGVAVADLPQRGTVVKRSAVTVEIAMQGDSVRKARKRHALRKRKPLMGERRGRGCGHYDLGEFAV
jgi:hypothetical protein